jgi:lipopolysaccharide transport system ATP-binding protein
MIDVGLGLDGNLTGRENIFTMARMRGFSAREVTAKFAEIIDFSELGSFIDLPVKVYSSGMASRLVFSLATTLDPDILLLDEWLGTGDAQFILKATERMNSLLTRSRVMVLASHSRPLIENVCNRLLVLQEGEQVYFGDTKGWDFQANTPKVPA